MTRSTRIIAGAAAVLLILAPFGWWFASPWWTLSRMREAAQAGDADALAAHVDFPALRASTREQLRPRLGPLTGLLAGPAVDALISPEALRLALLHGGAGATEGGSASDRSGADERGGATGRGGASEAGGLGEDDLVRTGIDEFRLRRGNGDLIFRRHGLGWKLEEIALSSTP